MKRRIALALVTVVLVAPRRSARAEEYEVPVSLRGSTASMERQNGLALAAGLEFVDTRAEQRRLAEAGELVRLPGNADYRLREGSRAMVARPETRAMVERVAAAYREACGERLVVTSATRATSRQPSNSHRLSVHPAGVAVDLRVSRSAACRGALEEILLAMEADRLLDVTREYYPPHYHVALFVDRYAAFEERVHAAAVIARAADGRSAPPANIFVPRRRSAAPRVAAASMPVRPASQRWDGLAALPLLLAAAAAVRRRRAARTSG